MSGQAPRTVGEAAKVCGARLVGSGEAEIEISGVRGLQESEESHISFYTNAAYRSRLADCRAAAVIVSESDASIPELVGRTLLVADAPYVAFAKLAQAFHPVVSPLPGIDERAYVDASASIDPTARVEAFAWIGPNVVLGPRVLVESGVVVGEGAHVGGDTRLLARSVVRSGCLVGERCVIQPGAVIGADGFGFAFDAEGEGEGPIHRKIPQIGIVRIEDDVEIGANACIDRAALGETVVGRGAKLDNLIQIAHNVRVGPLTVMAAQVGVAGSSVIGAGVQMGGQAGVTGHIEIGDMARIGAQAGVIQSVKPGETLHGFPAIDAKGWLRSSVVFAKLPELARELRALARRVATLEARQER